MTSKFSLLVVADTQYLFDGGRTRGDLLAATFVEVAALTATGAVAPVVHAVHVGDVTEHGRGDECATAWRVLADGAARLGGVAWTVASGNHDVGHDSTDQRGPTPFREMFGPGNILAYGAGLSGNVCYSPDGYSSWRVVATAGGIEFGVLALDWRPSCWAWARRILAAHRQMPTVVVSHDVAHRGVLTPQGESVRALLATAPQVFLVLGGHEWPSTRVCADREYHAINYQQLPFGGAGAARIYEFSPDTGTCQVISLCPGLRSPAVLGSVAARRALALAGEDDQFSFRLPPLLGGRNEGEGPWQAAGLRLVAEVSAPAAVDEVDVEVAGDYAIEVVARLPEVNNAGWQVLLARCGAAPDGSPEPLAALSLSSENFLGWHAYVSSGETWATSHEYSPGVPVRIVVSNRHGMWVNGDAVGRVDSHLADALIAGPNRWRIGAGEYDGRFCDEYAGVIERVRLWAADQANRDPTAGVFEGSQQPE